MTRLDEEQKDYVETITNSGKHLLDVVNDILDFSSIEKGKLTMETEPVVLREVVKAATVASRQVARDKKLDFQCEIGPDVPDEILGDGHRIRQILINLLGNAVKFTAQGSVQLRVFVPPGSAQLAFAVEDTGPGIPGGLRELLFEPFTQVDSTLHRAHEGTGLGLAISQRLAKAMGGSISVTSLEGKGCTFTFHLPLVQAEGKGFPAADPAEGPTVPAMKQKVRVLVVEDDPTNALLAGKMLISLAYVPEFATHGREALDAWAPGKFSAILMDMRMPVMDGLEATRKIREREKGTDQHVPIIALTANVMPKDSDRCLAAGMDGFLSKPFTREALASKLADALMSLK
jgi:CheY-like chemotaxis protein